MYCTEAPALVTANGGSAAMRSRSFLMSFSSSTPVRTRVCRIINAIGYLLEWLAVAASWLHCPVLAASCKAGQLLCRAAVAALRGSAAPASRTVHWAALNATAMPSLHVVAWLLARVAGTGEEV
jgi:hypothetical protein